MIRELAITDAARTCIPWWDKVAWLKGRERIEFKPGLNLVYGPNGSGKSTLFTAIARMLCCHQGGRQLVTLDALRELGVGYGKPDILDGAKPVHDGSPVMHFDPGMAVGLVGGMAAFDWDFSDEGFRNCMFKGSAGQTTVMRLDTVVNAMHHGKWPELAWKVKDKPEGLASFLAGSFDKVGPTVLLDEPSRSLDLRMELGLWKLIDRAVANGVQVIVATHSVIPILREHPGHIIETQDGFLAQVQEMLGMVMFPLVNAITKTGSSP